MGASLLRRYGARLHGRASGSEPQPKGGLHLHPAVVGLLHVRRFPGDGFRQIVPVAPLPEWPGEHVHGRANRTGQPPDQLLHRQSRVPDAERQHQPRRHGRPGDGSGHRGRVAHHHTGRVRCQPVVDVADLDGHGDAIGNRPADRGRGGRSAGDVGRLRVGGDRVDGHAPGSLVDEPVQQHQLFGR